MMSLRDSILGFSRPIAAALALAFFVALGGPLQAAPSLRTVLTAEEFQRAGLQKLTAAELDYLSARLLTPGTPVSSPASPGVRSPSSSSVVPSMLSGEAAFGHEEQLHVQVETLQQVPSEIQSKIEGPFGGWGGKTVFRLANGQVWRQAEPGSFAVDLHSPAVVIRKGMLGAFYLNVAGYGSRVKVKRIE